MNKIALSGFMGCGKTSIGRTLGENISTDYIDLDDITKSLLLGLEIPDYIRKFDGAPKLEGCKFPNFRAQESVALLESIANYSDNSLVLSLGGGTLAEQQGIRNKWLLNSGGYLVIYINTNIERILNWKKSDTTGNTNRLEFDEQDQRNLYKDRHASYMKSSDIIIENNGSLQDAINEIKEKLVIY